MIRIKFAVFLLVLVVTGVYCNKSNCLQSKPGLGDEIQNKPAPDFELTTIEGPKLRLSDLKGKVVLINFWATWCEACIDEIPVLVNLQKKYNDKGLQVVGILTDSAEPEILKDFTMRLKINYPVLQTTESVEAAYGGIEMLPTTFIIARNGRILEHTFGITPLHELESKIRAALSSRPSEQANLRQCVLAAGIQNAPRECGPHAISDVPHKAGRSPELQSAFLHLNN